MATRPAYCVKDDLVVCETFPFVWNGGFAKEQTLKNVTNLHNSIRNLTGKEALEISTKSENVLGRKLSAFNLEYNSHKIECLYQSSKVYENAGPFPDMLNVSPKDAKTDMRHKTSGRLKGFCLNGVGIPLEESIVFYDWLHYQGMLQHYEDFADLDDYDYFTDIVFNPAKSYVTQARSVALFQLTKKRDLLLYKFTYQSFKTFHMLNVMG